MMKMRASLESHVKIFFLYMAQMEDHNDMDDNST